MADLPEWRIRFDPVTALEAWPHLAAEWDDRWPEGADTDHTFGDQIRRADALAIEIFEREGILKPRERKCRE